MGNGFPVDITKPPTSEDLKSPILWLTQATALSESAKILLLNEPEFAHIPVSSRGICDSQYCAVALMIVGYSLEIVLKAMLIMQKGIQEYSSKERKYKHHKLEQLANFIPELSEKDISTLKVLSHFVYWAGRYPDPGSGREDNSEEIFSLSEKHEISANNLFVLSDRIMKHARTIIDQTDDFTFK